MRHILILGAGKIGSLIATLLSTTNDYNITVADLSSKKNHLKKLAAKTPKLKTEFLDASDPAALTTFIREKAIDVIVSCLPYYCNIPIIQLAKELNLPYFDLTEDTTAAAAAANVAEENNIFVPQCGLAPGFISIVAHHLMQDFREIDTVKLRVGALPLNISNALHYSLTWSLDGLLNEYGNLCDAIENHVEVKLWPLDGLEEIKIDGLTYEAFNTSGGIGTLAYTYLGKIKNLNYKTIRYPGHCEKMRFLMNDMDLNHDRETLKRILENVIPKTSQDVVLVYVSVTGKRDHHYVEKNYVKKFYSKVINRQHWSAIQLTTASSLCAVLDIVLSHPEDYRGLVRQEQISLETFQANRFGQYYA